MRKTKDKKDESSTNDGLIKVGDVAKMLGVSTRTVRGYVFRRKIPYIKFYGNLRFDRKVIERMINEARHVNTPLDI